jgi:hypothetical protein
MENTMVDDAVADVVHAPAELTEAQIAAVAGGLNPQPLPPRVEPHEAY